MVRPTADRGRPIARLVPVDDGLTLLDRLVAEGRATAAPSNAGPIPVPPASGDPDANAAADLAAAREQERW